MCIWNKKNCEIYYFFQLYICEIEFLYRKRPCIENTATHHNNVFKDAIDITFMLFLPLYVIYLANKYNYLFNIKDQFSCYTMYKKS